MLCKTITFPFEKVFKKIPKIVFDILFWLIIGFVFVGCANFLGKQGIFILISLILMGVFVILKSKFTLNLPFLLSLAFCLSYSIPVWFFTRDYFSSALLYTISLPVIVEFFEVFDNKRKLTISLLSAYFGGLFLSFLLIVLSTYWHQGKGFSGDVLNSFWGNTLINRTGISLYEIGVIATLFAVVSFKNKFRKIYTIPIIIFIIFFCTLISILIGNRSFLIPLAIIIYLIVIQKFLQPHNKPIWTFLLIFFNIIFVGFFVTYVFVSRGNITIPPNLMKIKIINRLFTVNISEGRPELLKEFFTNFYKYPFGNLNNNMSNKFVHNMILDFYSFGGVIPFLIGLFFIVVLFIKLTKFAKSEYRSPFKKSLLFLIVFSIFALSMIEPIYQANANCVNTLFIIFLYLNFAEKEEQQLVAAHAKTYNEQLAEESSKEEISIPKLKTNIINHGDAAVILIAFDKPDALQRSFNNLVKVDYLGKKVDLIISIDNSGKDDVELLAKTFKWPFGQKIIRKFPERQGLKKHILQCFQYAEIYDVIFLLEDDIYVSKAMFAYGYQAAKFYEKSDSIAGISLYSYQGNWQNWALRFEPFNLGFDNYFMKLAQSWGEVVTKQQWLRFKEWYEKNKKFVRDDKNVESINLWPESSWLKYFDRYCFVENKYFVYPYVGVATNGNGVGIHNNEVLNDFQVELQGAVKEYRFQEFDFNDKNTIIYDEYMNPLWLYHYLEMKQEELTLDLWCTKRHSQYSKYVLTAGYYGKHYIKSYSLSLHPIELSIIDSVEGKGIYLYETKKIKGKLPKTYKLLNYSLRTSDWRRIKFYSFKLFFKTMWSGVKRKVKRWWK